MGELDPNLTGLARWHPPRDVLELAELVVSGAVDALPAELPMPVEVALEARSGAGIALEDAEGTPVAALHPGGPPGRWSVRPLRPFAHGPVRAARRAPAEVRAELARSRRCWTAVPVARALSDAEVEAVLTAARSGPSGVLWLAMVGSGRRADLPPEALWRAVRDLAGAAAAGEAALAVPVAVPLLADPGADASLVRAVATAYGADEVLELAGSPAENGPTAGSRAEGGATAGSREDGPTAGSRAENGATAGSREDGPAMHPVFARELRLAVPPPQRRGVTVFFTGLSGSGKSTIAKAVAEAITEDGRRRVSLLDGDEVRRLLSAGLSFSRADRDLNIRRIGYLATEVTRHGGIAICAPIAPFAQVREEVRSWVTEVGDFVLVHVCTPLEVCERRDRKGLYAKARQGLIPDFTGISSPYESPSDADLSLDTSSLDVPEATARVMALLQRRGYLGTRD